jgi:hypothetical protein
MAVIQEEIIVIKLSKLVKEVGSPLTTEDFTQNIEAIVQELVSESVIVEVEKA